jgi:diphthamide synthase subunit DPH2
MENVFKYKEWKKSLNTKKTKLLVFTKSGRYQNLQMKYLDNLIDNVKQFTYLGIVFNSSGSFTMALKEILNKGMKALLNLEKCFNWS